MHPHAPLELRACPKAEWVGPLLPRAGPKAQALLVGGAHLAYTIWAGLLLN